MLRVIRLPSFLASSLFFFVRSSCLAKELVDPRTPHFQAYMPADHAHLQHRKHRVQWCNLALWACGYCFTRLFLLSRTLFGNEIKGPRKQLSSIARMPFLRSVFM